MTDLTARELLARYEAGERDFAGVNLSQARLDGAVLDYINLKGANLLNVSFKGAIIRSSDLTNAKLQRANLTHASLCNSNLENANLEDATINGTNLVDATLKGATLTNALFVNAFLVNTDLREVKPPFSSYQFWAELLAVKAHTKDQKALACLIAWGDRFEFCWEDFFNWGHPLEQWAIESLLSFNLDYADCPENAQRLKTAAERWT
jgi:hypothetical protein